MSYIRSVYVLYPAEALIIFAKRSILDVWQSSKYSSIQGINADLKK